MNWVSCIVDNDYEIQTTFPFNMRRKTTKRIIGERVDKNGNKFYKLNNKSVNKALIIA